MADVTRETLYQQIWDQPMTTVAKQYGVSSNYLARICEELKVPRRDRGYWAKRAAGRRVPQVALPDPDPGDDTVWCRGNDYWRQSLPAPAYTPTPVTRRRKKRPKTHPLVLDVQQSFEDSKPLSFQDDGYLKPKNNALPDIFVSRGTLPRALRTANQFFLQLEDRGHWVRSAAKGFNARVSTLDPSGKPQPRSHRAYDYDRRKRWRPQRATLVFIGGVAVGLTIFEIAEEIPTVYADGGYRPATRAEIRANEPLSWPRVTDHSLPNGRLGVFAYSPYPRGDWTRYWTEEKPRAIAGMLDQIATELEAAAPAIAQLEAEAETKAQEQDRCYEEEKQKRYAIAVEKAHREAVASSQKQLLAVVDNWITARPRRAVPHRASRERQQARPGISFAARSAPESRKLPFLANASTRSLQAMANTRRALRGPVPLGVAEARPIPPLRQMT